MHKTIATIGKQIAKTLDSLDQIVLDVDRELMRTVNEHYFVERCISMDYDLKENELRECYQEAYDANETLLKYATAIDKIDRISGPIEAFLGFTGFYSTQLCLRAAEQMIKIPFLLKYFKRVDDGNAVGTAITFVANEVASNIFKYGGIIETINLYTYSVKKHIRNQTAKLFCERVVEERGEYGNPSSS